MVIIELLTGMKSVEQCSIEGLQGEALEKAPLPTPDDVLIQGAMNRRKIMGEVTMHSIQAFHSCANRAHVMLQIPDYFLEVSKQFIRYWSFTRYRPKYGVASCVLST